MKDLTKANQKKSNFELEVKYVSLKVILEGLPKPNKMTIQNQIIDVLSDLTPSQQLRELEKLSRIIRKENSIRINKEVEGTRKKYPKK